MKSKTLKRITIIALSLLIGISPAYDCTLNIGADEEINHLNVDKLIISDDELRVDSLPDNLYSSLKTEFQNAIMLDRTFYSDVNCIGVINDDGTKSLMYFNSPVKYYNEENDSYCFIDNTITQYSDEYTTRYVNNNNSFRTSFPSDINDGVIISESGYSVKMFPVTSNNSSVQLNDNELIYKHVFNSGTDIQYSLENNGVKESIIVNSREDLDSYSFVLKLEGLSPKNYEGTSICLIDSNTEESVYELQPTYITDSYCCAFSGNDDHITYDNYYTVTQQASDTYLVHMNLDTDFLYADSTVYPCTIDPSISHINNSSSYIFQSGSSAIINNQLCAGNFSGTGEAVSYVKANSLSGLKWLNPSKIQSVYFRVVSASTGNTNSCKINCYDSNSVFNVSNVTFSGLTAAIGSLQSYSIFTTLGTSYYFNITDLFKNWLKYEIGEGGKSSSYGFILRGATGECTPGRYFSSTSSTNTYFIINYTESEEIESGFYNIRNESSGTYLAYNSGGQLYLSAYPTNNVCKWQITLDMSPDRTFSYGTYTLRPFNDLNVSMKGNTSGYSVTTGASGNKYRLVKNSDGTFRIMAVGSLNLISSNGVANSSNYATIEEYSSIDSMKWHFEPIVNRYFSEYTPDKFNSNIGNTPTILRMNCYGYAFSHILYYGEYRDAYKQQPGEFAASSNLQYVVDNVIDYNPSQTMSNVVSNMQLDASRFGYSITEYIPSGYVVEQFGADSRLIAVVSGATDYHFYMQHNDGTWSHKPGSNTVRNWSLASEVNHTYLTNNNIISEANQGEYENGSLKFFIITRDAVSDHPHAFALPDIETGLYYKDISGDNKTTSTAIYASTTQESCFDCYDDIDYYVFIPLSSQNYTISTTTINNLRIQYKAMV